MAAATEGREWFPGVGSLLGLLAGSVAVLLVASGSSGVALAVAAAGLCLGAAGRARRSEPLVSLGSAGLFAGVLLVGTGRSATWLLLASTPVLFAWATACHVCRLDRQLGSDVATTRVELVYAVSLATIVTGGGGFGYAVYRVATGSGSPLALGLLLLAVVALATVLGR